MHGAEAASRTLLTQASGSGTGQRSGDEQPVPEALAYGSPAAREATGAIIGRVEIPKLALSTPLVDGVGTADLQRGAGHIPGTALPGGLGTVGIAAHRDTFFRPLRRITPGMEVRVAGPRGTYTYEVESTEIVAPEKVDVLDVAATPQLTLITCYPFNYIGSAPQRFIVHARLLSLDPEPQK